MKQNSLQGVGVAILNGHLLDSEGRIDGSGEEIASLIRQSGLSIAILGLSDKSTPWAGASLNKIGLKTQKLLDAVTLYYS